MQQPLPGHRYQDSSSAQSAWATTAGRVLQLQHQRAPYRLLQTEAQLALLLLLLLLVVVVLPLLGLWASQAGGWLLLCWRASGLPTTTHTAAAQWLLLPLPLQGSHHQQQEPGPAAGIRSSHARGIC
jgi:hypothetical protein